MTYEEDLSWYPYLKCDCDALAELPRTCLATFVEGMGAQNKAHPRKDAKRKFYHYNDNDRSETQRIVPSVGMEAQRKMWAEDWTWCRKPESTGATGRDPRGEVIDGPGTSG